MGLRTVLGLKKAKPRYGSTEVSRKLAQHVIREAANYHPLGEYASARLQRPDDAFHQRGILLSALIRQYEVGSFCDLGCAEGLYVRLAAHEGAFAVGIDSDANRLRWAMALSELQNDWSAGFICRDLTTENIVLIPRFDMIACMSLMHHIIYRRGMDEAQSMLQVIAKKTQKCMVFDMGGPEEAENAWAESLSKLAGDVDSNIANLLENSGFKNVRVVGSTAGYGTDVKRSMFVAEPAVSE